MDIAKEIINKYESVSHMEAFIIAKDEYDLDDQTAMWVADDVYKILNPTPITKMKDWKKEIWEREDFQKLKELIKLYEEATPYYCETNHQMILVHLRINDRKSYRDVMDMINSFKDYEFKIWRRTANPIELDHAESKLKEYFKNIDDEIDKFFLFSNGNSEYLISTYDIREVELCEL